VVIALEGDELKGVGGTANALSQFLGRRFIKSRIRTRPELRGQFTGVGDVSGSIRTRSNQGAGATRDEGDVSPSAAGIERLRDFPVGWWAVSHLTGPRWG
jgi:hypothetical protein